MGKIHDALEKANKGPKPSDFQHKDFQIIVNDGKEEPNVLSDQSDKGFTDMRGSDGLDDVLVTLLKPRSYEAEQFKMLRTNLLFPTSGKPPRSIMVISAVPGEGKSFVAANLAITIAQSINDHVLLIDCDVRKPSVHSLFGFRSVSGLSEYLAGGTSIAPFLLKTPVEKLTILPAGNPPHNPAEILSSEKMIKLLEEVKTKYNDRYVIIDSPPPQFTAEANVLARLVDGIILVVKQRSTPRELVADLVEKIGKEKIMGVVLNQFDMRSSFYYGYGKYGNYKKYYHS